MTVATSIMTTTRAEKRAMTTHRGWFHGAGLLTLAALTLSAGACGKAAEADGMEASADSAAGAGRVINVEVSTLAATPFTEEIRVTGTAEANRDVVVAAEESGAIVRVLADKGAVVSAGQPIVKIDDRILASQVQQAKAQAELAQETWQRRKRLYEQDNVGSELAYLQARSQAEQTAAALETLQQRLDRTVVRAPFGGVLDDRMVEVGSMVAPGTPVARVVDLDPVKIQGGVPERYAADVRVGAHATVGFDVLGTTYDGKISYVGAAVNAQNRTFPVEFTIPNPGRAIKPAMVADVAVVRRTLDSAIVVPQDAIVRVEDGYVAFVVNDGPDGPVVERRRLDLGSSQDNKVVVNGGLEAGDRLVVVGQKQVAEGDRVRVVSEGGR